MSKKHNNKNCTHDKSTTCANLCWLMYSQSFNSCRDRTGPTGPTGPHGPTGPAGHTGPQGPAGSTGHTGPQGPAGSTGHTGPMGPTGLPGGTGAQGSQGPAGATGPQGLQGIAGATGATGLQGPTGPTGAFSSSFWSGYVEVSGDTPTVSAGNIIPLHTRTFKNDGVIVNNADGTVTLQSGVFLITWTVDVSYSSGVTHIRHYSDSTAMMTGMVLQDGNTAGGSFIAMVLPNTTETIALKPYSTGYISLPRLTFNGSQGTMSIVKISN